MLAHLASQRLGDLGLKLDPCGDAVCVGWVMPASHAWYRGARPGMRVLSVNGSESTNDAPPPPLTEAELETADGKLLFVRVPSAVVPPKAKLSLWFTGTIFALLGAAVVVRHPDGPAARLFGLFAGFTAVALGVAPAAGGPHPPWALIVQFVSLLALAASLPAFAVAFVGDWRGSGRALRLFWLAGSVILAGYLIALVARPSPYAVVRIAFGMYIATGIVAAVGLLARKALFSTAQPAVREARFALSGVACGTLPFVTFTLLPETAGYRELAPAYITAALSGLIPAAFAYAILRHQFLGIRRLIHRGMVYGIATITLLGTMSLLVIAADSFARTSFGTPYSPVVTAVLVCCGALLFHVLRRGTRKLVDRFVYRDEMDSGALLSGMRQDLLGSERSEEVVAAMLGRLRQALRLEAAVLFLGKTPETMRPAASAGDRANETIAFILPRLFGLAFDENGMAEAQWNSDMLVVAQLQAGSERLGFLILGPKEQGEVFVQEERELIGTVAPIVALAIRESTLLAELREVSQRLMTAEEAERARLARDLHDGPLQKAIFLGGVADATIRDRDGVARELVVELRELCARLRPAILDDLGLVAALEWLLEQASQGFAVRPSLTLRGMTEDDRLSPNTELAFFRATQEAVTNAIKHGHAKSIHVSLARSADGLTLSITDDGSGVGIVNGVRCGLGIAGMRERLRQLGGSVTVASGPGTGTVVTARIPQPGREGE